MKNIQKILLSSRIILSPFKNYKINLFSQISKQFSTIRLKTNNGTLEYNQIYENSEAILKSQLSKSWVFPKNSVQYNKITKDSHFDNVSEDKTLVLSVGKLTQNEFDRFMMKAGRLISNSENVYVQDGILKGKKIRIISSDSQNAARINSLLEETSKFESSDILVYSSNDSDKNYIFFDKNKKIIVTNSKSLEKLINVINDIVA